MVRSALFATAVKFLGAGLTYLMFVAVARVTDAKGFGAFGTVFSLASLVAFIAPVGQQSAVLRFFPEWQAKGRPEIACAFLGLSLKTALYGALTLSLGFAVVLPKFVPSELKPLMLGGATLTFVLAIAEFLAAATRAQGGLLFSLLPRDVIWRLAFIILILVWSHSDSSPLDSTLIVWAASLLLALAIAPQIYTVTKGAWPGRRVSIGAANLTTFRETTLGLWVVTSIPPAAGQASTVIVAGLLGLEMAGAFFAAERTARLVVLALTGLNQVFAAQISKKFHAGSMEEVRNICHSIALVGTACAAACVVGFVVFGSRLMTVFDPSYGTKEVYIVLAIFGIGQLVGAAAGPTSLILQVAGGQNGFVRILVICNILGLLATYFGALAYGSIGAATAISLTLIAWSWWGVLHSKSLLGINPSVIPSRALGKTK